MLSQRNLDENSMPEGVDPMSLPGYPANPSSTVPPTDLSGGYGGGNPGDDACSLVFVNLAAYQDGELDPDQKTVVEAHLDRCAKCAAELASLQSTDIMIQREWRDRTPLPSSSQFKHSIDDIMAALPAEPVAKPEFAPKRVHAKARWMRFSTGLAGIVAFFSLLWSTYRLGYDHGRLSAAKISMLSPQSPDSQNILAATSVPMPLSPAVYTSAHTPQATETAVPPLLEATARPLP